MKKRILFVMPRFGTGGAEKSLLMLLHLLAQRDDVSVDLLLFKKEGIFLEQVPSSVRILEQEPTLKAAYSSFSIKNIKSFRCALISFLRPVATLLAKIFTKSYNCRSQLRWITCYRHLIKPMEQHYDFACGYLDGEAIYYVVDKTNADKKIGWNHNDYNAIKMDPRIDRMYYGKLDHIATISDECTEILGKIFPEHQDKMIQTPNIMTASYLQANAEVFFPSEFEGATGVKLLSVGRLTRQKGFDLAIEAAAELKERGLDFRWYIIGTGELAADLEEQIKKNNVSDCFIMLGEKSNPYPYMKHADIIVQPSRFEGKSVVLSEAKILCKPIIATRYQTVADQLNDGIDGIIVEMTPQSIAAGIESLADNPQKRTVLSTNLASLPLNDDQAMKKGLAMFGLNP